MSDRQLISFDDSRNSAFDKVLHRGSIQSQGGLRAMMNKNSLAHVAASQEYFRYWDDQKAEEETEDIRAERSQNYATITRQ